MNKEFERCCTFLAEMMEKYGALVLRDIAAICGIEMVGLLIHFLVMLSMWSIMGINRLVLYGK